MTTDGFDEEGLETRMLRSVLLSSSKPKPEIQNYDGRLSTEVLLDWINELDNISSVKRSVKTKVKFTATKLKGHAVLWWDNVQAERITMKKLPINKWPRMVAKLKGRFLPKDY